jgi:hypothetical protein
MPHEWNNLIVVTKEELQPWYSEYNLRNTIQRYKDKPWGIKRACNGHNGQPMLILFDSLDANIQESLGDPRKCDHILQKYFRLDGEAVNYYQTFKFEDGSYLATEYQERYITNASLLKAVIALREARTADRRGKGGSLTGIGATLCSDAHSFQKTLRNKFQLQHTLPENERCFADAIKEFETEGYPSLISKKHKNQNTRKVTDETLNLLNGLFVGDRTKPTATEVHRRYDAFIGGYMEVINNETGELYDPTAFKKLSDATVKNYMASWASKIGTYALRSGNRQTLMQQFKPYHSLDKPKYAGSIISIDDRQPPFKTPDGKRVWFYNGIDLGSEAFTCWVYGDTKEGIIREFYRELVRNYTAWGFNLPNELEAEMSLNSSYTDTFLREGAMFQKVRIEANNARGKRIERYFRSLRYGIEKDREGWLARPFAKSESNQAGRFDVPALPYRTIIENGLQDIETWNNQPHSVHTHMSRWQVFCEMQHPDLKPINYAAILPHIGEKTTTSCRVGIIRLQYKEFLLGIDGKIALGDRLIHLMKQAEGKELDIYWLDDHQGAVMKAMVFIGTQYICEAIAKPTYNRATIEQTATDKANRQIMSSYVATIESFGKRQKNRIDTVTVIDNRPALKKDFVMPGLRQDRLNDLPTGGLLPEPPEDEFENMPVQNFTKSLKDRF